MLGFRAFVQQPDGFIVICDGTREARFASPTAFREVEPGYALPEGCYGVNLEERDNRVHYVYFRGNFPARGEEVDHDGSVRQRLEIYISKVAQYHG